MRIDPNSPFHPRGFICVYAAILIFYVLEVRFGVRLDPLVRWVAIFCLGLSFAVLWRMIWG